MTDTLPIGLTYLSPVGHYGQQNTQTLGGVSHLWQDFFARAMAEQQEEPVDSVSQSFVQYDHDSGEPIGGARALALIDAQRACPVQDTEVAPPEPLFLPIAEFDLDLMQKPYPPFPPEEIVEQQKALDFDNGWARPIVLQNLRLAA